jgi:hypothetical protein
MGRDAPFGVVEIEFTPFRVARIRYALSAFVMERDAGQEKQRGGGSGRPDLCRPAPVTQ